MVEHENKVVSRITSSYFIAAVIEIMAEFFNYMPLIVIFKPLMPAILMVLYFSTSEKKDILFFAAMAFSVITNVLFIPNTATMLFYGIIAFMIHRIIIVVLIIKLAKPKDYIPIAIATVPFLLIFFYLLAISTEIPENSYMLLIVQNLLIAFIGGLALSNYMMQDNKKNSWLLICSLLFVALQFIVFIEKYYLTNLSPTIFRPIAMGLNAFAFYTFYEFVLATEKSDENGAPA